MQGEIHNILKDFIRVGGKGSQDECFDIEQKLTWLDAYLEGKEKHKKEIIRLT